MVQHNLRYTIGDEVEKKYGVFSNNFLRCYVDEIGVSYANLFKLVHYGEVNREDFEVICNKLHPDPEIKQYWEQAYVQK